MSKFSKKIMMVLALSLVFVMVFAGCSAYKQDAVKGGDANAVVTSNGGLAVKQGDYLYYINGLTSAADIKAEEDNTFGNVVKGAIMRCKLDKNGNITDKKVLVPMMALSTDKNGGISVFGNWVYYTTPSIKKDSSGAMQTTYLEFMRTSINGTKTEEIATIEGTGLQYKYSASSLMYFKDGEIKRVNYNNDKILKEELVADKVSSIIFPQNEVFNPKSAPVDDVVFYTKAAADEKATYNETYAVGVKAGSKAVKLIDGKSYTDKDDKKLQYNITLKNYNVVEGGIEVYYEKANANDPENKPGLFGALYKDGKLDVKNEVRFTNKSVSVMFPVSLEKGIYVFEGSKLSLMKERVENGLSFFDDKNAVEFAQSGVSIVDFIDYEFTAGVKTPSILYMLSGKLYVRPLSNDAKINSKAISDKEYSIDTSWLAPEIIDGNVYFFNADFYKYMETMNIASGVIAEKDGKLTHPLANLNAADKASEDKKAEEEKNNNK